MPKTLVLVGASKGIGRAIVAQLANNSDFQIIAISRTKTDYAANNVVAVELDLNSPTFKEELEAKLAAITQIDYLINNAGHLVQKPFLQLSRKEIESCYNVNVISVFETVQVCFPKMTKGGHIVQISSMGGVQGTMKFAGLSAYSTSKAAVISLTELLAEEFKDSGVRINCLSLGAVQTEMFETAFPQFTAPLQPNEMAEYIVDFTLNAGKYMHGRIVPVSLTTP